MKLNDDLVLYRVVLDEPFQCIQAAEPDRGLAPRPCRKGSDTAVKLVRQATESLLELRRPRSLSGRGLRWASSVSLPVSSRSLKAGSRPVTWVS
jgi:hypothetical protein